MVRNIPEIHTKRRDRIQIDPRVLGITLRKETSVEELLDWHMEASGSGMVMYIKNIKRFQIQRKGGEKTDQDPFGLGTVHDIYNSKGYFGERILLPSSYDLMMNVIFNES